MKSLILFIPMFLCIGAYSIKLKEVRKERDFYKNEVKELKKKHESTNSN